MTNERATQTQRHEIGRHGQDIARYVLGGEQQTHKAPFDIVDFTQGKAYEVKTLSAMSATLPIHITADSMRRKLAFARKYHLKTFIIAVVVYNEMHAEIYRSTLKKHILINNMTRVK